MTVFISYHFLSRRAISSAAYKLDNISLMTRHSRASSNSRIGGVLSAFITATESPQQSSSAAITVGIIYGQGLIYSKAYNRREAAWGSITRHCHRVMILIAIWLACDCLTNEKLISAVGAAITAWHNGPDNYYFLRPNYTSSIIMPMIWRNRPDMARPICCNLSLPMMLGPLIYRGQPAAYHSWHMVALFCVKWLHFAGAVSKYFRR